MRPDRRYPGFRLQGIERGRDLTVCAWPANHGANSTQTGCGTASGEPVAVRRPVAASTLKTVRLLLFMLAQTSQRPSGERLKLRGWAPPAGTISTSFSVPSAFTA